MTSHFRYLMNPFPKRLTTLWFYVKARNEASKYQNWCLTIIKQYQHWHLKSFDPLFQHLKFLYLRDHEKNFTFFNANGVKNKSKYSQESGSLWQVKNQAKILLNLLQNVMLWTDCWPEMIELFFYQRNIITKNFNIAFN